MADYPDDLQNCLVCGDRAVPVTPETLYALQMSTLDQIRKLDEQRQRLVEQARDDALKRAQDAIAELNELGFAYHLAGGPVAESTSSRRPGIRQAIVDIVIAHPQGIPRAKIIEQLTASGEEPAGQSVSNALGALKKQGKIIADGSRYKPA